MRIAVCCITYNRLTSLTRLLQSLDNAYYDCEVNLVISVDKSETDAIENFVQGYQWRHGSKRIITHEKNLGLRAHILSCGMLLKEDYDAIIVLEDDIVVSPNYYRYAVQCVDKYRDDDRIAGISLYNFAVNYHNRRPFVPLKTEYDIYLMNCAQSWGQVWMRKSWFAFYNWYHNNSEDFKLSYLPDSLNKWPKSSWLKYHTRYCIEQNKYFVFPYCSLSTNNSDEGTHVKNMSSLFQTPMSYLEQKKFCLPNVDEVIVRYDGFFEPKFLYDCLGFSEKELCIDTNNLRSKYDKRYVLTSRILNFRILKCYGLDFKPWEINVFNNNLGYDLFLYDTQITSDNPCSRSKTKEFQYIYGNAVPEVLNPIFVFKYYWNKIIKKISSFFK